MRRLLVGLALALVLGALGLGLRWLVDASTIGAGFAAKVTCSLVHVSGQDGAAIVSRYVAHEVAPLGAALRVTTSPEGAEARVAGGLVRARAVLRPGLGCVLVPSDAADPLPLPEALSLPRPRLDPALPWPRGGAGPEGAPAAVEAAIARAFMEPGGEGLRQTNAVVVAKDGRLLAERYAPGYGPETPMLSWSMAKSVLVALVGVLEREGRMDVSLPAAVPEWRAPGDPRGAITLDQLLRQSSGLAFDETYGATNDVSRMLYAHADTGAYAAKSRLVAEPGTRWSYSSGTSNLVARIVRDVFRGDVAAMVRFANDELFDPADMTSAFFEPDASGSFVGSSYVYMTARDWARFGELFRRHGDWFGRRILPADFVRYAVTPTPAAPRGSYGAHFWLNAGSPGRPGDRPWPAIPPEVFAARGHSGQWVVVVPSARLVVVRLGLTVPDEEPLDGTEALVAELLQALADPSARNP